MEEKKEIILFQKKEQIIHPHQFENDYFLYKINDITVQSISANKTIPCTKHNFILDTENDFHLGCRKSGTTVLIRSDLIILARNSIISIYELRFQYETFTHL